jgi:streptogramin lyase
MMDARSSSAVLFSMMLLAGCASQSGAIPQAGGYARTRMVTPERRGVVTLFDDTFGDAVPAAIAKGPDGDLWFTDTGNATIGRITVRGKYTLQKSILTPVSSGITIGPDKNVWFTLQLQYGGIGRITTSGKFKLFADPGGAYTQGITTGPDGALWFTESNGTIGRRGPGGKIAHFTVAPANAQLEGIVTGPDGNLWVTQYTQGTRFSNQVIRMTTRGTFTSYTVGYGPAFICVGPDGALWFTENSASAIGRLTTAGKYREFPIGNKYYEPFGIAAGPDSALWFTDFSGSGSIGRMTTAGKMTFYKALGSFPELQQITAGRDGNMWFTSDLGPSAIGRVTTH